MNREYEDRLLDLAERRLTATASGLLELLLWADEPQRLFSDPARASAILTGRDRSFTQDERTFYQAGFLDALHWLAGSELMHLLCQRELRSAYAALTQRPAAADEEAALLFFGDRL